MILTRHSDGHELEIKHIDKGRIHLYDRTGKKLLDCSRALLLTELNDLNRYSILSMPEHLPNPKPSAQTGFLL